jgi:hypothetical protein
MRLSIALAALAVMLGAAGCGGASSSETQSSIPESVAGRLAAQSDSIAAALEAGDDCGAAQQADDLRHAADKAISTGEVPAAYQGELEAAVTSLQNAVNCAPEEDSQGDENGKGKEKGHDKHDGGLTVETGTTAGTTTGEGD